MPDEVSEEICPQCGRNLVIKSGRFGRFLACPGWPECDFTMPLVVEMPGKCPKCGGRLLKRTGKSKKTGKQYTYYCCEHLSSKDESRRCDFMTWDVPVKDNCPVCGWTMFKKSGRGFKKPFCINEQCSNFTPEEKRGGWKKKTEEADAPAQEGEESAKKPAAKKSTSTKRTTKKADSTKKSAKTTTKKTTTKENHQDCGQEDCGGGDRSVRQKYLIETDGHTRPSGGTMEPVLVIGAGLAGSEAAWQLANRGIPVRLHEMKPNKMTPAHHSADLGSWCAPTPCARISWRTRWACSRRSCAAWTP